MDFQGNHPLIEYVKSGKPGREERVGVLIAMLHPIERDRVLVGFSKCNMKMDKFSKKIGLQIAFGRAISFSTKPLKITPINGRLELRYGTSIEGESFYALPIPYIIRINMRSFIERARKYFNKDGEKKFPEWVDAF